MFVIVLIYLKKFAYFSKCKSIKNFGEKTLNIKVFLLIL